VKFEHATGDKTADNFGTYNIRWYEGRYVMGQIAAKMSKKGLAGYIVSFPIPEVIMGIDAFMLGAQSVNPNFKIKIIWVNSWFDPGKEGDAANVLINQGADVLVQQGRPIEAATVTATLEALPDSAWTQITLDRRGAHNKPQVHEQDVTVRGCPVPLRQIAVRGLGHDHPTLILTNDRDGSPKKIVGRYAKRMRIEQRLAEQIRSFHLDSLSSAVALNVDLDTTLTVWAAAAYDHLRQRLPGYEQMTPDTIWRRFISTSGKITIDPNQITCRLNSRTYSPIMRSAKLPPVEIPWWNGRQLRFQFA